MPDGDPVAMGRVSRTPATGVREIKASGSSRASPRAVTLLPIVFTPLPEAVAGKPVRFSVGNEGTGVPLLSR